MRRAARDSHDSAQPADLAGWTLPPEAMGRWVACRFDDRGAGEDGVPEMGLRCQPLPATKPWWWWLSAGGFAAGFVSLHLGERAVAGVVAVTASVAIVSLVVDLAEAVWRRRP